MKNLILLCGGESGEHEVSLQSATSILNYLPKNQFNIIPIGITYEGDWVRHSNLILQQNDPSKIHINPLANKVHLNKNTIDNIKIDIIFSVIHGNFGEDGCLQGLFELNHIPYVGSSVLGSAVGMDKDFMKKVLEHSNINITPYLVLKEHHKIFNYEFVIKKLGTPFFIKPCNAGSSLGISKCKTKDTFVAAIKNAFQYDSKILIEKFVDGRELEIAVLGNEDLQVSCAGEVISEEEFYSYEAKYILGSSKTEIPAKLNRNELIQMQSIAKKAYDVLELKGMARIDFFMSEGVFYINEVNTLPGFTKISMYPKLWEASGIKYSELLLKLITLAEEKFKKSNLLKREYSPI